MDFTKADECKRYPVKTNMRVLLALRTVMKQLGLQGLFENGNASSGDIVKAVFTALMNADLVNEFCQVVTDSDNDFMNEEIGTVMWVINDFFAAMWWQMPPSWQTKVAGVMGDLAQLGRMTAIHAMTGGTIQPTGSKPRDEKPKPEI